MFNAILFLSLLNLCLSAEILKDIKFENATVKKITSIYDGDSFRVNIKDYPRLIGYRMAVRINGIDTPEMRYKCENEKILARKAKQLTVSLLRNADHIELRNIKRGKYFRIIADVYVDDISIADELLKAGYAARYEGGTKIDWCK
jgi:endonuclease YncB( thermonuclease family)